MQQRLYAVYFVLLEILEPCSLFSSEDLHEQPKALIKHPQNPGNMQSYRIHKTSAKMSSEDKTVTASIVRPQLAKLVFALLGSLVQLVREARDGTWDWG